MTSNAGEFIKIVPNRWCPKSGSVFGASGLWLTLVRACINCPTGPPHGRKKERGNEASDLGGVPFDLRSRGVGGPTPAPLRELRSNTRHAKSPSDEGIDRSVSHRGATLFLVPVVF